MKYLIMAFVIIWGWQNLKSNTVDDCNLTIKKWPFQNSDRIYHIVDSCVKKHNCKCIVLIDKSIIPHYDQYINQSYYVEGIFIIHNDKSAEIIYLDEFNEYYPVPVPDSINIDIKDIEATALRYSELCGEPDFFVIDIGQIVFSLMYFDIKQNFFFCIDNDLETYLCEKEESFAKRIYFKKYFRKLMRTIPSGFLEVKTIIKPEPEK
jgi:hypothetical protein